jgi:hypothetical protein
VDATINPNPVPFSGVPITDSAGCAGSPNTWFYNQILTETANVSVVFTSRIDTFDGRIVNNQTNTETQLGAGKQIIIPSRWCSSQAVHHTAQTTFIGKDANGHTITVDAPVVNLNSK